MRARSILAVVVSVFVAAPLVALVHRLACDEPVPLGMGYSALTPLHCAVGEIFASTDILQRHGFDPELIHFERGKDQHEACSRGRVDATFTCEVPAMVHLDRLPGLVIDGCAGELGDIALVVPADSPISTVEDLAGARVALLGGASSELLFDGWLVAAGLRRDADVRVEPHAGIGDAAVRSVLDGQADAAVLWDPWLSRAELEHDLRVVRSEPFWSLVATFEDHPSVSDPTAYLAAVQDALAYAAQHTERVVGLVAQRSGIPAPVVERVLRKNRFVVGEAPALQLPDEVRHRLAACEMHALTTRRVRPEFRLDPRMRAHP